MKNLCEITFFEIRFLFGSVSTWIYCGFFLLLAFAVNNMLVEEAQQSGDLFANSPIFVSIGMIITGWMGMLVTAAIFGNAATRDVQSRMHPLFFTTPVSRTQYLSGRFTGAFIVNALLLVIVPFVLMFAAREPFVGADLLGPFIPAAYLWSYLWFMLPNLFISAAILFALAALSQRTMAAFGGVLLLFLISMLSEEMLAEQMSSGYLGALLDPFGFVVLSELVSFLTPLEQNIQLITLDGILAWNRLLWIGAGVVIFAITCSRYRMTHHIARRKSSHIEQSPDPLPKRKSLEIPQSKRSFGLRAELHQMVAVTGQSLREIVTNRSFLLLTAGVIVLVFLLGWDQLHDIYGTPIWPATQYITGFLSSFFIAITITLLTVFYAGELIWRERDTGLNEIADAVPVPNLSVFTGKFLALGLVLIILQAIMMASGMILQLTQGYFNFEPGLYVKVLFGLQLADYLLFAMLAMLVHVVVNRKYVGHLILIFFYVFTLFAGGFGIHHNLILYGSDPGWVYSDLSGFGPFLAPFLWFKLYWMGWALLFAVIATLFWVRCWENGFRRRISRMKQGFSRSIAVVSASAALLILVIGGFIYYNTNVLNDYRTSSEQEALRAEYELLYGQYKNIPQPQVTGTKLHVEIFPERREVEIQGTYRLENRTAVAIDTLHLFSNPIVSNRNVDLNRPHDVVVRDDVHGHGIYVLDQPLQPGDSLQLRFEIHFEPQGFPNRGINTSVVGNGTYFDHAGGRNPNHRRWLPVIGYQANREITDTDTRQLHGLNPKPLDGSIQDTTRRYDSSGRESIDFEAVIGTSEDQIAVAPGNLQKTWTENGRRYFHYATSAPMKNVFAIFSANYDVYKSEWIDSSADTEQAVPVEIFHHPGHTRNLDRLSGSIQNSLDYLSENFGPYPHDQIRIVEFPRYANLAYAYPGTISYAEGFGFLTRPGDGQEHLDTPFMVTAHEVAHQWWGQQIVPAAVEGGPLLTEVLAQYSALMILEKEYGTQPVRRFLDQMWIEYMNRRNHHDVPLIQVSNQSNLIYRKGALVMYTLRGYIGEETINTALRNLIGNHGTGNPPYPVSTDLLDGLKAVTPDSLQYLITDLFEENTLWELRTNEVRAEPIGNQWQVTLEVETYKMKGDSTGDRRVSMDDFVEVAIFPTTEDSDEQEKPIYLQMHHLQSGAQTITVTVPEEPARAGLDPFYKLIDRRRNDNVRKVGIKIQTEQEGQ